MSFKETGLSEKVLAAVAAAGYTQPTPIQAQAIPHALVGRDVLGIAQTGTGKTAAFTLPMLCRLEQGRARARMPRTLILEPTRELAAQVEEAFVKYGVNHKLNVALLIGGVSFSDQEQKIMRGADVLIATPGRMLDFFERGKLLLTGIEILVIDEADRMLDMGFIPDIEKICKLVPFTRQTLFFSATMPPEITRLTEAFLHNPVRVEVAPPASAATTITQGLIATGHGFAKRETLRNLIRGADNFKNAIIFSNRKRDVATLHKSLVKHGFNAGALHGDMDQPARMASLDAFKSGAVDLIVCSDVAARGLDIPDVSHVFNFDLPTHAEDYVHRIGRTGRAGKSGTAFSLVTSDDKRYLADIEKLIGKPIDWIGGGLDSVVDQGQRETHGGGSRGRSSSGGDRSRESADRAQRFKDRPRKEHGLIASMEPAAPVEPGAEPAPRPRRDDRPAREARPPRQDRAPRENRQDRAPRENREERAPLENRDNREARAPREEFIPKPRRDDRRPRRDDLDDGPAVVGLGDHVPSFLMRPTKFVKREDVVAEE